ncbi:DNA ligase D, 3'-phosphoesterase domain-containing protein [Salegentibacter echinorum]|uniref:DNA ligase D, 3'-phosphoesterase domain-containing protein n=1 Tax=Salegentibacter echinorum TaxID=1073325 RepID=A0A1M5KE09_SALEC|nr:DNA polymerase ligase N-terminal domain-containing protein [Salegentibacter echinorum]SHG50423.1 DNA ligase D, 3'-phosphoesterase domain-containing protein [Salegentibacter echinorum]
MSLQDYNKKRDFKVTGEPKGSQSKNKSRKPLFVIQKHDATNLHYDFRLEIDNTLKSWSIPKGPSTNPEIKRMAIPTEDHPKEYANFEGVIPKKQYGGGTVMIWDKGTFRSMNKNKDNEAVDLKAAYEKGAIDIYLEGEKIYGGYSLIKMKSGQMKGNWLLIKKDDDKADARRNPVSTENKSVVSGRSMEEIAAEEQ